MSKLLPAVKQKKEWELWVERVEVFRQSYQILDKLFKNSSKNDDVIVMSQELGEQLGKLQPEDWPKAICSVIDIIYLWQNNLHLGDIPPDAFDNIPHLHSLGDILLQENLIKKIDNCDNAFPYKLTMRGLLFYSMLKTLKNVPDDVDTLHKLLLLVS